MTIKTRFAPSPTGYLHLGGARTALYCWLFARQQGGKFVLRVEDTDVERSSAESVKAILDAMDWLGLDYDEGPHYQTERLARYAEVAEILKAKGLAYECYCTREELDAKRAAALEAKQKPRYDGTCRQRTDSPADRTSVLRFRNPDGGAVTWTDAVYGQITFANDELDDLIILRSDGMPTYNFAVVVDDMDMQISHVVRGDDHINNTPRQINLYRALGADVPTFAHLPMILGDDGKRMSKRHGAVSVMQYAEEGYLPDALLNYLVRLGWSHGDQEIFDRAQMTELFSFDSVNRGGAHYNLDKLNWLSQQYFKSTDAAVLADLLAVRLEAAGIAAPSWPLSELVELQRERVSTLKSLLDESLFLLAPLAGYEEKAAKKHLKAGAIPALQAVAESLNGLDEFDAASIHAAIESTAANLQVGFGKVALPLRVATTGSTASPVLDATLALLGRTQTAARIAAAIAYIEEKSA